MPVRVLALLLVGVVSALHSGAQASSWSWQRLSVSNGGSPITAVAAEPTSGRLAVGDATGVLVGSWPLSQAATESTPIWRRWPTTGAVTDLHFGADGALWVGTLKGLWRLGAALRLEDRSPAPGDEARFVHRVRTAMDIDIVVVATEGGAFVSREGVAWQRIVHGLPSGPMRAVALRTLRTAGAAPSTAPRLELWLLGPVDPWRLEIRQTAAGFSLSSARRERILGRPIGQAAVDLGVDLSGAEVAVLYTQALARALPAEGGERRWEVAYPVLPPGASTRRLSAAADRVWLSTDRGLLVAPSLSESWSRAASPAGSAGAGVLTEGADGVFVVSDAGLLWGRRMSGSPLQSRPAAAMATTVTAPHPRLPIDPDLRVVHEQALEYVGIEPDYFRGLRRGLGRRGWLPILSLRAAAAYDRDTSRDKDETFTFGALHDLHDSKSARSRDFDGSVILSWDLGDIAYAPDAPDLSREGRQVVTLRDNMLDEINQLYFDRRRALVALSAYADRSDPEAVVLELRSQELAAGLDAWTGGWFSGQIRAPGEPPRAMRQ